MQQDLVLKNFTQLDNGEQALLKFGSALVRSGAVDVVIKAVCFTAKAEIEGRNG